jgi:hypothetical protein
MVARSLKVIQAVLVALLLLDLVEPAAQEEQVQVLAALQLRAQVELAVSKLHLVEQEAKALTVTQTWPVRLVLQVMPQAEQLLAERVLQVEILLQQAEQQLAAQAEQAETQQEVQEHQVEQPEVAETQTVVREVLAEIVE